MVLVRSLIYRDGCEKDVTFTLETVPFFVECTESTRTHQRSFGYYDLELK